MFAERLELFKGRKQFDTTPHLKFDKFHHNKRIAIKLQRCILASLDYLCSLSWFPDHFKLSKTPPKYKTHLSWYAFSFEVHTRTFASRISMTKVPSAGKRLSKIVDKQKRTLRTQRGRFDRKVV